MDKIHEPARSTPVRAEVDVLVIGGGAAGIAAAVAAARSGASVMLADRYGFLGGTLSAVTLGSICGLYTVDGEDYFPTVGGFAAEFVDRLKAIDAARDPVRWLQAATVPYDSAGVRLVADDVAEACGVTVALHALLCDVVVEGDRLAAAVFQGRDGRWAVRARAFVDGSGDGDVAALAGVSFELDLASLQFPTTMFRLGGVDTTAVSRLKRPELHAALENAVRAGFDLPRTAGGIFPGRDGTAHLNITRVDIEGRSPNVLDTVELSAAERSGRRQVQEYIAALRGHVPGFAGAYLLDFGTQIGIRESRRIVGRHRLTSADVLSLARFDDAIARCSWPIEEHGTDRATRWVWLPDGGWYDIPLGALLPATGPRNLVVAGRCASADHEAQASLRVAAQCFAMGEAAGIVAAMSLEVGGKVESVPPRNVRDELLSRGGLLEGPGAGKRQERAQSG